MSNGIELALDHAQQGRHLEPQLMELVISEMLAGLVAPTEMRSLLLALREKGETVSEMVGAARALRKAMLPIHSPHSQLIDTCGTGGDGLKTFNISTAAAIVVAACGLPVAKHGNRAITSASGSADVLAELGIKIDAPRPIVEQCLADLGICFCFAPLLHPAMKQVSEVRRSIHVPTLFNYLGPLCNPASASLQLLGVGKATLQRQLAEALQALGTQRAFVVRGEDGLDEVTLAAPTHVLEVTPLQIRSIAWSHTDFDLPQTPLQELAASNPQESADCIRAVLLGEPGPKRSIVVANAAAALHLASQSPLSNCAKLATEQIDNGKALQLLTQLAEKSHLSP